MDGNGWPCEGLLLLPATGQTAFGLPFPALDVFHSGYSYVSSPTPNGTLGPYWFFGLERMCVVLSSGERRLPGTAPGYTAWRGTPTEITLSTEVPDDLKRVRELTVYDANGSAMRFLAFITGNRDPNNPSIFTEIWTIVPSKGVQARLEADVDETGMVRGFVLYGGPPGRIREGGSWVYRFGRPAQLAGWGGGYKSRLHDNMFRIDSNGNPVELAITSPNGNRWSVQTGDYNAQGGFIYNPAGQWLVLRDLQTRRGLRWNRQTGEVYYFALSNERQGVLIGQVPLENDAESWSLRWSDGRQAVEAELQHQIDASPPTDRYILKSAHSRSQVESYLEWTEAPEREREMYFHAYGSVPDNLRGRLLRMRMGSFLPFEEYQYAYGAGAEFWTGVRRPRPEGIFTAHLYYNWDRGSGMFTELEVIRPSFTPNDPNRAWERELLTFNEQGQVMARATYDQIGRDANGQPIFDPNPRWQEFFAYSGEHPFAITTHIDRQSTIWQFEYVPDRADTLLSGLKVQGGALGEASVQYAQSHADLPYPSHPNPPTAPTHIQVGNDPALTWRFDYTFNGAPYAEVSANGLLTAFTEPGRSGWWQLYYWGINSPYPNKLQSVVDPTGRQVWVSAYDLFGRPNRVELFPMNATTPLWQETEWTLMGQPLRLRWGYGGQQAGQAQYEYDGLFLKRYTDPRGRLMELRYDYELDSGSPAGHLREIWLKEPLSNSQQLYAELRYDGAGRLEYVRDGERKSVLKYRYGLHDELRGIHHLGDTNEETFDYSCCGRVSLWRRQDGRFATFDYTPNGWIQSLHEHDAQGNPLIRHGFEYDDAGRLGRAERSRRTGQTWQPEIELRFWYDTDDPNFGVAIDPRNQDNDPNNNLTSAHTGWLLGESITLPIGPAQQRQTYQWWYEYRMPDGTRTADLQAFFTSWGSVWRYTYDGAGRPLQLYQGNQLFAEWSYDNAGRVQNQTVYLPAGVLSASIEYVDAQAPNAIGLLTYRLNGQEVARFDYRGTTDDPGYYPDGTLRVVEEQLVAGPLIEWRYDYAFDGSLAYEQRSIGSEVKRNEFAYDPAGNLTRWGDNATDWRYSHNQLLWVGGSHPWLGSYNWYLTYTPNGERARLWNSPTPIEGDVNGDGRVDDGDLLLVMFKFGQECPQGCPEDLNGDGRVDDSDLLIVQFNYGQSAGSLSWGYQYDVWGNLTNAVSGSANVSLNQVYDSLGRRVGLAVYRQGAWTRLYRLYEGDTLLAEVDAESGQVLTEYVWGPLGPIARLDYTNGANTRYYVVDGLGHVRVLLSPEGTATDVYYYDSWGNPIPPSVETTVQPLRWNGAYGYEWDCYAGTGLYHVGAREYDPRTARWLQRDPIDTASGDPNLYRYCGNDPVNYTDPSGLKTMVLSPCDAEIELLNALGGGLLGSGGGLEYALRKENRPDKYGGARLGYPDPNARYGWARTFHIDRHPIKGVSPNPVTHLNAERGPLKYLHHKPLPDWAYHLGQNRVLRGVARGAGVVGVALDAYDIATASPEDRGRAIGGAVGGAIGSAIGATIGSALLPGVGTVIGGAVGGVAGSVLGQWIGSRF